MSINLGMVSVLYAIDAGYARYQRGLRTHLQNLMKLGHTKRAQLDMPEEEKPPIRKYKTWVIGIVIFITGNILNFVSFGEAPGSLRRAVG